MTDERFDARAATYDEPHRVERAQMAAKHIMERIVFAPPMRLLDYGAGTGLVSEQLAPTVGSVTLADRSQGMLAVLRAKAAAGRFGAAEIWDFDLGRGDTTDERFDRVVSAMVLHHIVDLGPVLRGIAELLSPDGVACLVDLDHDPDGSFHTDRSNFAGHDGFDRAQLRRHMLDAGFGAVEFADAGSIEKHGRTYPLFLAIGHAG